MEIVEIKGRGYGKALLGLLKREYAGESRIEGAVRKILRDVKKRGDSSLIEYTKRFDRVNIKGRLRVNNAEVKRALGRVSPADLELLKLAAKRIESFHRRQIQRSWSVKKKSGIELGMKVTPLKRVGIYVPGGKAAYPSTVLMNAIPAKVAGVEEVVMVTPPSEKGEVNPYVLAAASLCGIKEIYRVGGAQAIAALSYGTETIPSVDKIVGPGNIYVATAKRLVFGKVDIDMVAGPSEVLIINDGSGKAGWIAADLLSQAEHDELSSAILITTSRGMAEAVAGELKRQVGGLKRKTIAKASLKKRGMTIIVRTLEEAIELANLIAPEHLELFVERPLSLLGKVRNAGAVFLGPYTPEAAGDYLAGPNHTLPTSGTARFSSPLGVYDFVKSTSVVRFSKKALKKFGPSIERFAAIEGLDAHAKSVGIRL